MAAQQQGELKSLALSAKVFLGEIDLGVDTTIRQRALDASCPTGGIYQIFVAGLIPSGLVVPAGAYLLNDAEQWNYYTGGALPAYLSNINSSVQKYVDVSILNGVDLTPMKGAKFLVGYGTTSDEMLTTGCYKEIYEAREGW